MDSKATKQLKWFVKYAYTDFDNISKEDLEKIAKEILLLRIYGFYDHQDAEYWYTSTGKKKYLPEHKIVQKKFRAYFGKVMEEIQLTQKNEIVAWTDALPPEGVFEYDSPTELTNPHGHLSSFKILNQPFEHELKVIPTIEVPLEFKQSKARKRSARWAKDWRERTIISVKTHSSTFQADFLIFHFLNTLNGLHISIFRLCPECGHWYIHTSKKKRTYCSNKCAARSANREKREKLKKENKEKYEAKLAEEREKSHDRYEKKQKKRFGPNVSVKRRPIKKYR